MHPIIRTVLMLAGVFAIAQGASAAFVFNPTLTMYEADRSSTPPLIKVIAPIAKEQRAHQQVECDGTSDI